MTSANKQDTTSSTFRCAWICRTRRFSETCQLLCPLECRDGAAMSKHCHQRRTRQLCRLPVQANFPVAALAPSSPNDTRGHQVPETLGNLRSCKCHRRAAFAHCIRDISFCHSRLPRLDPPTGIRWRLDDQTVPRARASGAAHLSVERDRVAPSLNVSITKRAPGPRIHPTSPEMADNWLRNFTKV